MAVKGKLNVLINRSPQEYQTMHPLTEASQILELDKGVLEAFGGTGEGQGGLITLVNALINSKQINAARAYKYTHAVVSSAGSSVSVTFESANADYTRVPPVVLKYSSGTAGQTSAITYNAAAADKFNYDVTTAGIDATNNLHPLTSTSTGPMEMGESFTVDSTNGHLYQSPVFNFENFINVTSITPPSNS